jgi:hypothetical protein
MEIMRKVKVIETGDGELAIQLTDEEIKSLNWKVGDDIEWSETENGFKLTKVELNIMKKVSDTYKKLGIAFTFPIEIKDSNGNLTYFENSDGEKIGTSRSQSCAGKVIEVDGKKYKLMEL